MSADDLRSKGYSEIPGDHPAVATIPGCVDGLTLLAAELGTLGLRAILAPAISLAADGFPVSTEQASAFSRQAPTYSSNPAVADFYPGGEPVGRGDVVRRPALAHTLAEIAEDGRDAFYQGVPGEDIIAAVDGLITSEDMGASQAEWVDPIGVEIAGLTAWTTPPNSQGYLGPATVAVFEMLDPPTEPDDPGWWHLLIEAYRCLAWERNDLVADPSHLALPAELILDRGRLERAAASVDRERAGVWPERLGTTSGTAYLCTVDDDGMAVSIIQSNYRGTGSPFGAARSGFLLQDRGMGFSLMPGHPNELGPGKRPLHTLAPTVWTEADHARWALGTRGGAVQPQLIAQVAARAIVGGSPIEDAQAAPRWTVTDFGAGSTSNVVVEPDTPGHIVESLRTMGHDIIVAPGPQPGWGPVSIIEATGAIRRAAADPRVDTTAALIF